MKDYSFEEPFEKYPLAMAYVPWQHFQSIYEPDKALQVGTVFPELNKPFLFIIGVRGGRFGGLYTR